MRYGPRSSWRPRRRLPLPGSRDPAQRCPAAGLTIATLRRNVGVKGGYRKPVVRHAVTEALILELEDGSILGIDLLEHRATGAGRCPLAPDGLQITLWVTLVPPLRSFRSTNSSAETQEGCEGE